MLSRDVSLSSEYLRSAYKAHGTLLGTAKKSSRRKAAMQDRAKKFKDEDLPWFLVATERNMVETLVSQAWEIGTGTQQL